MIKVAPSILSADFAKLGKEVEEVKKAGADYIHYDVMDGNFVPNISVGLPVLKSLRKATDMFIDVHLMVDRPVRYAERFCDAGADLVNFHVEADTEENTKKAISLVKGRGVKAGVTLKPATPAEAVLPFLADIDLVLVMTVEPGFGGQSFMAEQLEKIRKLRGFIDELAPACELEVDGGINPETAKLVCAAGANVLVSGSCVFGAQDRAAAIKALKQQS